MSRNGHVLNLTGPETVPIFGIVRSIVVVLKPETGSVVITAAADVAFGAIPVPETCMPATIVVCAPWKVTTVVPTVPDPPVRTRSEP